MGLWGALAHYTDRGYEGGVGSRGVGPGFSYRKAAEAGDVSVGTVARIAAASRPLSAAI